MSWELVLLTAITLPFLIRGLVISTPVNFSAGDVSSPPPADPNSYILWYEAHQIYGCDPAQLSAVQLATVKQSCRCDLALDKYARHGLDSLTVDECEVVVNVLPNRYPRLEEFPAFEIILHDCRQRLAGAEDVAPGTQ